MTPDPEDVCDFYEERAGLIEFDGGAPRRVAEIMAIKQTVAEFGLARAQVQAIVAGKEIGPPHGQERAETAAR